MFRAVFFQTTADDKKIRDRKLAKRQEEKRWSSVLTQVAADE